MSRMRAITALISMLFLGGCAGLSEGAYDNTVLGAGLGAAAGYALGGDARWAVGGAAVGGAAGNIVDRQYAAERQRQAVIIAEPQVLCKVYTSQGSRRSPEWTENCRGAFTRPLAGGGYVRTPPPVRMVK